MLKFLQGGNPEKELQWRLKVKNLKPQTSDRETPRSARSGRPVKTPKEKKSRPAPLTALTGCPCLGLRVQGLGLGHLPPSPDSFALDVGSRPCKNDAWGFSASGSYCLLGSAVRALGVLRRLKKDPATRVCMFLKVRVGVFRMI